jgi:hypothetical protein
MDNKGYLYDGELNALKIKKNFISDDFAFKKHPFFTEDTTLTVQ